MFATLVRGLAVTCLMAGAALAQPDDHTEDHDHIEECPPFAWGGFIDPGQQTYDQEVVAGFDDGRLVLEVRFGPLEGPVAKHFMFLELIDGCVLRAVSVGSYMNTVLMAGKEVVHVDLYDAEEHSTLATLDHVPPIETVRDQAMAIFLGVAPAESEPPEGQTGGN